MIVSDRRFQMNMWGNFIAFYRNAHVDESKTPWTLKDVYPTQEEIKEMENEGYTQEEFLARAEKVQEARKKKREKREKALKKNGDSTSTAGNKDLGGNS